jgi:hypothetical protein
MKIIINEVVKKAHGNIINFSTEYGNASALWKGTEPQINKEYFVEFEIPDVLYWRKDIISAEENCLIATENDKLYLVGFFESIDDDGYTVIKLGDSIVSVETQGEPLALGSFVMLSTNNLLLYEVNY